MERMFFSNLLVLWVVIAVTYSPQTAEDAEVFGQDRRDIVMSTRSLLEFRRKKGRSEAKGKGAQRTTRLSCHPLKKGFAPFLHVIVFVKRWSRERCSPDRGFGAIRGAQGWGVPMTEPQAGKQPSLIGVCVTSALFVVRHARREQEFEREVGRR